MYVTGGLRIFLGWEFFLLVLGGLSESELPLLQEWDLEDMLKLWNTLLNEEVVDLGLLRRLGESSLPVSLLEYDTSSRGSGDTEAVDPALLLDRLELESVLLLLQSSSGRRVLANRRPKALRRRAPLAASTSSIGGQTTMAGRVKIGEGMFEAIWLECLEFRASFPFVLGVRSRENSTAYWTGDGKCDPYIAWPVRG